MRKLSGLLLLLAGAVLLVQAEAEGSSPTECTPLWVDVADPLPVCDLPTITGGLESHPFICLAGSAEDATVIVDLIDCRKATTVPAPTAAWLQHDIHAEVSAGGSKRQLWASDRHSWKGAGRDLANRVLAWLGEAE